MYFGEISDYSDLTAGQYEGFVLKRERHYKWRPYWCVLHGRQLTFYEDRDKEHVAGRIELQPGSHCDKGKRKAMFPSLAELFHKEYSNMKKYPLRLKTKKGIHMFTYEDVKEQSRWQMAINNASQENASGVRLSWIPTPFSMVTSPIGYKNESRSSRVEMPMSSSRDRSPNDVENHDGAQLAIVSAPNVLPKSKSRTRREDTRTLIHESDSEMSEGFAFTNPNLGTNTREMVTSL